MSVTVEKPAVPSSASTIQENCQTTMWSCQEGFQTSSDGCGCDGKFLKALTWNPWCDGAINGGGISEGRGLGWEKEAFTLKKLGSLCGPVTYYCMNLGDTKCSEPQILISKVKTIMGLPDKSRNVINVKGLLLWLTSRNHSTEVAIIIIIFIGP